MRSGGDRNSIHDNKQLAVYYGTVTQNKDPDKKGRIKVKFEWLSDTDESQWAQLVTPLEGKDYGWYALPDIGDVVVVAFTDGDMEHPLILGGIWSTPDFSPETNEDGKNHFRGYRSRSGHRMILDDSTKVKVVFADKTGKNTIGIGEFAKDGAGPNVCAVYKPPMSGTTGISFSTLEGGLDITCTKGKLTINAEQAIKFNILETSDITSGKDMKFEAKTKNTLTAGSPAALDATTTKIQ